MLVPAWYAVMALPYLMEYPHECSEQVFNRLYANALARHIAQKDPKVRRVFIAHTGRDRIEIIHHDQNCHVATLQGSS